MTGCYRILYDVTGSPGAGWGFGPELGVEIQDRARGGGNSGPGRGVVGIQAPGAGWAVILARVRGGGGDSSPGAGWRFFW